MSTRTLLRGGTVITAVRPGEVLTDTDILIGADGTIEAIGQGLDAADAEVIDVRGRIVHPGFVDTHRHTWQSVVRNLASDWSLTEYLAGLHTGLSKHFRPEDTYTGNYLGALEALDSGITTLVDWSHNLATPEHADAAVAALKDTGMRAVFAHGGGAEQWGSLPSANPHPADARRVRDEHFSSGDGLVTMALALRGPQFVTPEVNVLDFRLAADLDLRVTMHAGDGYWGKSGPIHKMNADGLLSDRITYVHCCTLSDDELRLISDSGGTASVAPDVEMQMGHGFPATGRLLRAGIRPTFSIDVCSSNGGDMFATMRTAIGMQRALDNAPSVDTGEVLERISLTCADVVQFATIDGAHAAGLAETTGSLAVGKAADIVVLDDRSLALTPLNNPIGSLVYSAHPGLVRDVFVQGRRVKKDGELVGVDLARLKADAEASRSYLLGQMPEARLDGTWHPTLVTA
ncbi:MULTISPECIES: amidohydrolase family protein [Microbacterium]|jgi:cytosine/adenosine deaminase-related metal-dependent hydrolase|uniref:Amidohydrolase family protein n=1 Tax=Microbacterium mcarthurae TaxID=3035918 RepID=A0ABW9GFV1_9MICO|nr:amidohydrolase family protein [Microbacterium sp. ACRRU]MCG7416517.1 amidohydrolase family protein [Microbacterium sp. ACRRU]